MQELGCVLRTCRYYGAPEQVVRAYDPTRGTGSFGIVAFGACGYTNVPSVSTGRQGCSVLVRQLAGTRRDKGSSLAARFSAGRPPFP